VEGRGSSPIFLSQSSPAVEGRGSSRRAPYHSLPRDRAKPEDVEDIAREDFAEEGIVRKYAHIYRSERDIRLPVLGYTEKIADGGRVRRTLTS